MWKIYVEDFPAFIVVDDKGNDFFKEFQDGEIKIPEEVNSSIYMVLEFFEDLDANDDQMLEAHEIVSNTS